MFSIISAIVLFTIYVIIDIFSKNTLAMMGYFINAEINFPRYWLIPANELQEYLSL
ncbi:hypothetical protein [Cronobacter dublinensis]|uniref:hypothetical protein n=1 Tax=Cronobacter dublinensis TaxID=413497 RepID=UPI00131A0C69|nr:hypothetical protein [Cronobacter dublinensis]